MKYPLTAQRLRTALNNRNMTQQELADKSGIGKSSISHYINGANEPGNKSAYAMAEVLGVAPAWLMGLDVEMEAGKKPQRENGGFDVNQYDKERINGAIDLYEKYLTADPNIRAAIDALLRDIPPASEPLDKH